MRVWVPNILYLVVCLAIGVLLIRAIVIEGSAAEALRPISAADAVLPCPDLVQKLTHELWAWYADDIRALGPEPLKRGPFPGNLSEWESLRRDGEGRCANESKRLDALGRLRVILENNSYLLSHEAGSEISQLRE